MRGKFKVKYGKEREILGEKKRNFELLE